MIYTYTTCCGTRNLFLGLGILVFDNAITREQELQEALKSRKAKALRENRSALMESAVAHRLLGKDHEKNMQDAMQEVISRRAVQEKYPIHLST